MKYDIDIGNLEIVAYRPAYSCPGGVNNSPQNTGHFIAIDHPNASLTTLAHKRLLAMAGPAPCNFILSGHVICFRNWNWLTVIWHL